MREHLLALKTLFSDRSHWTSDDFAKTAKNGNPIGPQEANATCWCILGGVSKVAHVPTAHLWEAPVVNELQKSVKQLFGPELDYTPDLAEVNDGYERLADGSTGYDAIMKIIDHTLERFPE